MIICGNGNFLAMRLIIVEYNVNHGNWELTKPENYS